MSTTKEKLPRHYWALLAFALLGIAASIYLLVHHVRLKAGLQGTASFCSLGTYADCDVVNASPYAEVFHVPLATFGAIFYFLALIAALLAPPKSRSFGKFSQYLVWWLSFGALCDTTLFLIQIFALNTACLMCLLSYVATGGMLYSIYRLRKPTGTWKERARELLFAEAFLPIPNVGTSNVLFASVAILCFFGAILTLPYFIRIKAEGYAYSEANLEKAFLEWRDLPVKNIDTSPADETYGNPKSKVKIVEFSDFECPFCRRAAFTVHTTLKPLQDKVFFVFKNFPLDESCNPYVPYPMHLSACHLAKLGYCARMKNSFWPYHDLVFMTLTENQIKEGTATIDPLLHSLFTDTEIRDCLKNPKVNEKIAADIRLANSLGIHGTPTVYINGKQVKIPLTVENLTRLITIEEELASK